MIDYSVSDGVCVVRLNAPPVNTITFPLLEALCGAIGRAGSDEGVRGIVVTGGAEGFSAGADVGIFRRITCADQAVRTSRLFQEAFQAVEDSPKPVVAALAGRLMGSAVELAAACHFRVCTSRGRFNMPEVTLGINPGAGGTGRLPRLVGPAEALKMLLTGETVAAGRALGMGLVDLVCSADELLDSAVRMARADVEPRRTGRLTEKVADAEANAAALSGAEELLAKVRPEIIAPRKIAEAVRIGLAESFEAGLRAEQEAFAECMATPATRNKLYLFFATRETAKVPDLAGAMPAAVA